MKTEKIYTQHNENKEWMNKLLFYKEELKIIEGRLAEVASKNNKKEILAFVEHFQNKFIIQNEVIDNLKHGINISNDAIKAEIRKNGTAVDHRQITDHSLVRNGMDSFENLFKTLRGEFNEFVGQYL